MNDICLWYDYDMEFFHDYGFDILDQINTYNDMKNVLIQYAHKAIYYNINQYDINFYNNLIDIDMLRYHFLDTISNVKDHEGIYLSKYRME
jgi:hypothetical protein